MQRGMREKKSKNKKLQQDIKLAVTISLDEKTATIDLSNKHS